jgi:SAM-dependent methyltransferase
MLQKILSRLRPWPVHPMDKACGIETSKRTRRWRITSGDAELDAGNVGYAGASPGIVRHALRLLPPMARGATFIDLGCGKGRVLAVATEFPFSSIAGIELADALHKAGRRNMASLASRFPSRPRAEVFQGDATRPEIPDNGDVVLFLYNPFYTALVRRLVAHLEAQILKGRAQQLTAILCNPVGAAAFDESPLFTRYAAEHVPMTPEDIAAAPFGNDAESLVIWQSVGPRMATPLPGAERSVLVTIPEYGAQVQMV